MANLTTSQPQDIQTSLPISTRLFYSIFCFSLQFVTRAAFFVRRTLFPLPSSDCPYIKTYPYTPHLSNRIFTPPKTTGSLPPPLFLSLHGGGFIFAHPSMDDKVNAKIRSKWNALVISLNYPKSPGSRYPILTQQIVSTILAILADETLIFDRSRVAIGGYSAGGHLALSASQDSKLKGKIHAVVPFYPVTDFTISAADRVPTRPYSEKGESDPLVWVIPLAKWAFVPIGHDLRDPGLSPSFARREDLPEWVCTVGAELDMLCCEAGAMMGRLAGIELVEVGSMHGLGDSEKDGFEVENGRLKWVFVKGATHGFTHGMIGKEGHVADKIIAEVGEWLWKGAWKSDKSI